MENIPIPIWRVTFGRPLLKKYGTLTLPQNSELKVLAGRPAGQELVHFRDVSFRMSWFVKII